jgi:hypothetical protein
MLAFFYFDRNLFIPNGADLQKWLQLSRRFFHNEAARFEPSPSLSPPVQPSCLGAIRHVAFHPPYTP